MRFFKSFRNINRLREILFIIASSGFGKYLDDLYLTSLIGFGKKIITLGRYKKQSKIPVEVRIRKMLEDLGPTFIKIGQMLSVREDVIPENLAKELSKLQDHVKPIPFNKIEEKLKNIYGDIDRYFKFIDEVPLATASIAQVHRGVLVDGKEVVLKVKRDNIKDMVDTDFSIAIWMAQLAEKYIPEAKEIGLSSFFEEFYFQFIKELDFEIEASYMEKFRYFFKENKDIVIPEVVDELSNDEIIVMEYYDGVPIDEVDKLKSMGFDTKRIAEIGVDFYMKQVFDLNFFHADPHPGNFLISADGKLVVLDFGIIGKIDKSLLVHLSKVFKYLIEFNVEELVQEYVDFGIINEEDDLRRIKSELYDFLMPVYGKDLKSINIKKSFERLLIVARRFKFRFPKDYLLIIKTFMFLESTGRKLYPDFNMLNYAKRYIKDVVHSNINLEDIGKRMVRLFNEYIEIIEDFPAHYRRIIKKMEEMDENVKQIIKEIDEGVRRRDRAFNRISFSILISVMIMVSTVLFILNMGPKVYGISVFALIGLAVSFGMGILLFIGFIRSGRL